MTPFAWAFVAAQGLAQAPAELDPPPAESNEPPVQVCNVRTSTEVKYVGLGYDHIVHLGNDCDAPVTCEVMTDADGPFPVTLDGHTEVALLVRRGSPLRDVTTTVTCAQDERA